MAARRSLSSIKIQGIMLALSALRAKLADIRSFDRAKEADLEQGFDDSGKQVVVRKSSPEEEMIAEQMLNLEQQLKIAEIEQAMRAKEEMIATERFEEMAQKKSKSTSEETSREGATTEVDKIVEEVKESYRKVGITCEVSARTDVSNKTHFVVNFGDDKEFSASLQELQNEGIAHGGKPGTTPSGASSINLQGASQVAAMAR